MNAKTYKEARQAIEFWKLQYQLDDVSGESYLPAEKFSNFALHLVAMYKTESQGFIQGTFNKIYDLIQGTQKENLFENPDNTPRSLSQAIYETLNIEYNGQHGSNVLGGDTSTSQRGKRGSNGIVASGERAKGGNESADNSGGVESGSGQVIPESRKGRKNVANRLNELRTATKDKDKINILRRIEQNVSHSEEALLTDAERAEVESIIAELQAKGYEWGSIKVGDEYRDGDNIIATVELNEDLPEGTQRIKNIIKPCISLNGKVIQEAEVVVEYNDYKEGGKADLLNRRKQAEKMLEACKRGNLSSKVAELEKEIAEIDKQLADIEKTEAESGVTNNNLSEKQQIVYDGLQQEIDKYIKDAEKHKDTNPAYSEKQRQAANELLELQDLIKSSQYNEDSLSFWKALKNVKDSNGNIGYNEVGDYIRWGDEVYKIGSTSVRAQKILQLLEISNSFEEFERLLNNNKFLHSGFNKGTAILYAAYKEGIIKSGEDIENAVYEKITKAEGPAEIGEKVDDQGNPIDNQGKLITEKINSIDDITDEDFENPTRSVELPKIPQNVDNAIGANGKPVIIKRNVLEKNRERHGFSNQQSRDILKNALYNPDLVGRTQPTKRPKHWVAIQLDEKSPITVLEVNENKDNVEIVGWYTLDKRNLERIKRQATNEGGELLILSSAKDKVESLSTPNSNPSSADKDTQSNLNNNKLGEKVTDAEAQTNTSPTEAQKEAGNYKKGHVQVGTFDLTIENPKGSERGGTDANGNKWSITMQNTYGYIRGTEGVDGDHIDVFLSDDIDGWDGRKVFVMDQYNEDGTFDEHKVMLGFNNTEEAESAYYANYESNWKERHPANKITAVNIEDFKKWIDSSRRKTKAFADYSSVKSAVQKNEEALFTTRKLKHGEKCKIERKFAETGLFNFTAGDKMESADDVAYIFKQLETATVENSFVVLVKDGVPTIVHLAMGTFDSTVINNPVLNLAFHRVKPDKVYFVHNHPSGNLDRSSQDVNAATKIKEATGVDVTNIIIDTTSGKYATFEADRNKPSIEHDELKDVDNEHEVKVYSFSKQVFSEDYKPQEDVMRSSTDIAAFISGHRLGKRKKLNFLVLTRGNNAIGNMVTSIVDLPTDMKSLRKLADKIADDVTSFGGDCAVLYGTSLQGGAKNGGSMNTLESLLRQRDVRLLDGISVKEDGGYDSFIDNGWLSESEEAYGESVVHDEDSALSPVEQNVLDAESMMSTDPESKELEKVNEKFNEELQKQIDGTLPKGHVYRFGNATGILQSAGIPNLPIEMAASKLSLKASKEYNSNHPFDLEDVINLPSAIQHPIAVFDSKTKAGSKIVLVELKDKNGNNFVVAMNTNVPKNRYSKSSIQVNDIRSVYPKDNAQDVVNWINRGDLLRYADKKKIEDWITQQRSNSAEVEIQNLDIATKIIEDFENPTLSDTNSYDGDILMRDGDTKRVSGGRTIKFTKANPTQTFNAIERYLRDIEDREPERMDEKSYSSISPDIKSRLDVSKARTGSKYINTTLDGVEYKLRFSNHTKGEYGEDFGNGIEVSVYDKKIDGIELDLSLCDINAQGIKNLMHEVNRINGIEPKDVKAEDFPLLNEYGIIDTYLYENKIGDVYEREQIAKRESEAYREYANEMRAKAPNTYVTKSGLKVSVNGNEYVVTDGDERLTKRHRSGARDSAIKEYKEKFLPSLERWKSENDMLMRDGNSEGTGRESEARRKKIIARATELSNDLGTSVRLVEDVNEITHSDAYMQTRMRKSKGWYNSKTGEVVFVVPNNKSAADASRTVTHEIVAHKGLRALLGKHFNAFLDKVYKNAEKTVKERITGRASREGWNTRKATEEYMADLAENGIDSRENRGFWKKVRDFFMDMIHSAKIKLGFKINDSDLKYMLWRSYENLRNTGVMGKAKDIVMRDKLGIEKNDIFMRDGEKKRGKDKVIADLRSQIYDLKTGKDAIVSEMVNKKVSIDAYPIITCVQIESKILKLTSYFRVNIRNVA